MPASARAFLVGAGLLDAGADGIDFLHLGNKDLAVAEGALVAAPGRLEHRLDHKILVLVLHHREQQFLGDLVIGDLPDLDAPLFAPAHHAHLGDRREPRFHEGGQDGVHLFRPHHRSDHDHDYSSDTLLSIMGG
jgi:hypothetical protein